MEKFINQKKNLTTISQGKDHIGGTGTDVA
jgi:hypothetical protein